jgi:hypothetical protein
VALVERGRCGSSCKVGDTKDDIIKTVKLNERNTMPKLKIGNVEVEVCDTVAGAYSSLENQVSDLQKEKKVFDEEMKKKEEDTEKEMGSKDAEIEMLKKEISDLWPLSLVLLMMKIYQAYPMRRLKRKLCPNLNL